VDAAIVRRMAAAPDHPTTLEFPEGDYLSGLALLVRA
jgi:23S rRNA (cytosine1962-C5)-methyltransferase